MPPLTNKLAKRAAKFGLRASAGLATSILVPVLFLPVVASNVAHSVAGVDAVGCLDAIAALCVQRVLLAEAGCDVDNVIHAVASGSTLLTGDALPPPPPTAPPPAVVAPRQPGCVAPSLRSCAAASLSC